MDLNEVLKLGLRARASDIHIKAGLPPVYRIDGALKPLPNAPRMISEQIAKMADGVMNASQKAHFEEVYEVDLAYGVPGLGRFRVNVFRQRGSVSMVFRVIPFKVQNLDELQLPGVLKKIGEEQRGLVLVTGATGSGKSTTLAAMIDYINGTRTSHIVTIEDPIEYLHRDKRSIVNQREVGFDTESFDVALKVPCVRTPTLSWWGRCATTKRSKPR